MVLGGGLALYQLTSLVLGPAAEIRQLPLAISAPSIDLADTSQPVIGNVRVVLGTMAQAVAPAAPVAVAPRKSLPKIAVPQTASQAPKTPVQIAEPTPAPRPVATPTPQPSQRPEPIIIKRQPPTN